MLIAYLWAYGGLILATIVCLAAAIWGGVSERIVAATFWLAWILTLVVESTGAKGPGDLVILIDTAVLVIFVVLSARTRQLWLLLATASQLDDVASHFSARLLHYGLFSYVVATGIWGGYFITACLAAGTIGHQRRLRAQKASKPPATAAA